MDAGDLPKYGCGCVVAFFGMVFFTAGVLIPLLCRFAPYREDRVKEANARQIIAEYERAVAASQTNDAAIAVQKEKEAKKEDKIRAFAMRESPVIWRTVQELRAERTTLEKGVARVERVLGYYGRDLASDRELVGLWKDLQEVDDLIERLQYKLEDAYLKYVAYQSAPGRDDLKELSNKALVEGVQEAGAIEARFNEMRLRK